eukprot:g13586.t1
MLPVTPGLSPESSASRAGVTSFDNVLPDFGEPAGLFLPSTLDPSNADAGIPNLPLAKEEAEKKQTDAIAKVLDQLTRKFLAKVFPPGAEVNNRDSLYGGRAGCAFLLVKNKSYFLSHDYFMSQLVEKLHYRHLDQAIADFLTPSITWGQDRKEKSSLLTGSMGLRFARLYHKWLVERETAYVTGTVQDEVDLNLLEENVNWMEYLPGEGEGFLCGRAGYLRALLWLLSASRYDKTTTRLLTMIEQNAAQMVESLGKFAREQPYETTAIGSSSVFVSLALRCRELTGTKNTLLRNSGDVGGSMGLIGIYYVLLLILREWNLRDLAVLEWQSELLDSLLFLESKENVWNGYPENLSEPWSGGRFTENTFNNGATGAVWLFALAHEVFQRDSFLKAAERAAEHTWKEAMTIAKVGIEEARRAPELSVALVQYDANGQKGKLADLQRQFHSSQQESSTQLLSANRLGHSTSVSGMGAYNNSSPIPPIPARATSRHRTHREVKAQSQMKDQNSREPMAGASSAAARSSGRQAQVKGFLLPPPTVETLRNKKKRLGNPFGKAAASTAGAPSEQEEEMPMTVSHPDKLGILHDNPKTGRSVATRPFLINHGKGALARIANVRNVATWDGGVFRLAEQQDPVVVEKDVLDIRLFAGCAGNAYAMLRMAKANPDTSARWLHRARQLAHLMCDQMESHIGSLGAIDFQLGDGFGGLLAFLIDVLNPHSDEAKFPLFE